jgi:hypothetical protein
MLGAIKPSIHRFKIAVIVAPCVEETATPSDSVTARRF